MPGATFQALVADVLAAAVAFVTSNVNAASQASYTFTAQSIGTASADRFVVVNVESAHGGVSSSVSGVTIGGVAATKLNDPGATTQAYASQWGLSVPNGATADIVVTFSAAPTRCGIGVYAVTKLSSQTALSASATLIGLANPLSVSVNVPPGAIAIGSSSMENTGVAGTYTWAGLTKDYDALVSGGITHSGASGAFPIGSAALTVSTTYSQTPNVTGTLAVLVMR